jgi:hypothetical protein
MVMGSWFRADCHKILEQSSPGMFSRDMTTMNFEPLNRGTSIDFFHCEGEKIHIAPEITCTGSQSGLY